MSKGVSFVDSLLLPVWTTLVELAMSAAAGALCIIALFVRKGRCRTNESMEGKTVIVTGANAGIGKETAKEMARRKARVILACRNMEKAKQAAQEIFQETGQPVFVKQLDLASLRSVREFAADILKTEPRLDVLINNAGIVLNSSKVQLTEDGFEMGFQSNFLGHFLLTMLLVELLKKSSPSRVINVSSILHHVGSAGHWEEKARGVHPVRSPVLVYSNTKLAQLLFTKALAARLKGTGVTVNAVHPGNVKTEIANQSPGAFFFNFLLDVAGKTTTEGAQTSIFAAVHPKLARETGNYYVDCKKGWISRKATDRRAAERLFQISSKLVDIQGPDANSVVRG